MGNKISHDWTVEAFRDTGPNEVLATAINVRLARAAYRMARWVRPAETIALCHGALVLEKRMAGEKVGR